VQEQQCNSRSRAGPDVRGTVEHVAVFLTVPGQGAKRQSDEDRETVENRGPGLFVMVTSVTDRASWGEPWELSAPRASVALVGMVWAGVTVR